MIKKLIAAPVCVAAVWAMSIGGAGAQPVSQRGLVNVNVSDVGVEVPISVAANVCDVNVAVLVDELQDGSAPCDASSDSTAEITTPDGGPVMQDGLVNVNLSNVAVQVPIALAANVCDVNVGVLVRDLRDSSAACSSDAVSVSRILPV